VLQEEHLRGPGLVVEVGLRVLALLAAEGGIGEDIVEFVRRTAEQAAIGRL
jgi:hypothetical protein